MIDSCSRPANLQRMRRLRARPARPDPPPRRAEGAPAKCREGPGVGGTPPFDVLQSPPPCSSPTRLGCSHILRRSQRSIQRGYGPLPGPHTPTCPPPPCGEGLGVGGANTTMPLRSSRLSAAAEPACQGIWRFPAFSPHPCPLPLQGRGTLPCSFAPPTPSHAAEGGARTACVNAVAPTRGEGTPPPAFAPVGAAPFLRALGG